MYRVPTRIHTLSIPGHGTHNGGPDIVRKIFPTAVVVSAEGAREVAPTDIESAARAIIERRAAEHEEAPR